MRIRPSDRDDLARLRAHLAGLALDVAGLRTRRIVQKYSADQPRVPSGNADGGQWTDGGGVGSGSGARTPDDGAPRSHTIEHPTGDPAVSSRTTLYADGGRVASTIKGGGALAGGSERYTVIAQNGDAATFETVGRVQTVYGADGRPLARNAWTSAGAVPVPLPRPAVDVPIPTGIAVLGLSMMVQQEMLRRQMQDALTPVLAFRSRLYDFDGGTRGEPTALELGFVGELSREETERACPKLPLVQSMADEARTWVGPMRPDETPATYGTRMHTRLRFNVRSFGDPTLKAEEAWFSGEPASQWDPGHVRFDVVELAPNKTVCIYDLKTGRAGFPPKRAGDYAKEASMAYENYVSFLAIEIRNR